MAWFAIQNIYRFDTKSDGTNVFEERVVCFEADSAEAAHTKADEESAQYARQHKMEIVGDQEGYELDGDALIDGYEVWSKLYESHESPEDYYENRYTKYTYRPESPQ